jgi:uroporphyrinogen III methyltransferase/synthase
VPRRARVAAIGPATRKKVEEVGLRVDVTPKEYRAEALIEALAEDSLADKKILIPRAKVARGILPEKLREAGAEVVVPPAYESMPALEGKERLKGLLENGRIDCVTFTASSTVENFVWAFGADTEELLARTRVACIGPITARTAREHGLRVDAEAEEYTIPGLVDAVADLLTAGNMAKKGG